MKQLYMQLHRGIAQAHMRTGMPYPMAHRLAASQARIIMNRFQSGVPEELLTVGMGFSFKSIVKSVTKPFKKAAKWVEKKVTRPIGHGVMHVSRELEQHVIRPIAHSKYLATVANVIPGYGQALSIAIAAAQAARTVHVIRKDVKKAKAAMAEFERVSATAYQEYMREAARRGIPALTFGQFKDALIAQAEGRTF